MKNRTTKIKFQDSPLQTEQHCTDIQDHDIDYSSKAFTSTMTENLISPPARVWDKIEKILDEQDNRRDNANKIIEASFYPKTQKVNKRKFYLTKVAGLGIAVGLIWIFF